MNNSGTVQVLSGTLSLQGGSTEMGSLTVSAGGTLGFDSGTYTLGNGNNISGTGTVEIGGGTVNVNAGSTYNVSGLTNIHSGTVNFNSGNNITTGTLTQSGGTLAGSDTITVSGLMTWTGGTESGTGTTEANGGLVITASNAAFTILDGRTLTNAAAATVNGSGTQYLDMGDNAVLSNLPGATFEFQADVTLRTNYEVSGTGTFNNQGTLEKAVDTGSDTINFEPALDNSGSVLILSGTLSLQGGSTDTGGFTVSAGATLGFDGSIQDLNRGARLTSGPGTLEISSGTANFNSGSSIESLGTLTVSGGTVNFSTGTGVKVGALTESGGTLTGGDTLTVSDILTWTGGTMSGSATTVANGGIAISGGDEYLDGRTLNNYGTATWGGTGNSINFQNGAVWNNEPGSVLDSQADNQEILNDGGAAPAFNNLGTLKKSQGSGTTTFNLALTNSGNVEVDSGTLALTGSSVTVNGYGSLATQPAATLSITGNLLGSTQQADLFSPEGTLLLNGSGNASSPQLLEVMSQDLGNVESGFTNNFAYGTIALGSNTYVQLVDNAHNSSGNGPEAIYVNALIVPSGTTLDLNGFHLYALFADPGPDHQRVCVLSPRRRGVCRSEHADCRFPQLSWSSGRLDLLWPCRPGRYRCRRNRQRQ